VTTAAVSAAGGRSTAATREDRASTGGTDSSSSGTTALVPTGHEAASYVTVRSLARRGVDTIVASEKDGVPAAASRFCSERASLPDPREELLAYRDALIDLAERDDVATVVPVRPEDGYLLSRYYSEFDGAVSLPVPTMRQLERVHDRLALADAAATAEVPAPETRPLSAVSEWDQPLLVKSRYNVLADAYIEDLGPEHIDVVKDLVHVDADEPPERAGLRRTMHHEPIVQEFIPKDGEFVVGALYDHGTPLLTFQHEQIRGTSYTGGGGVYRQSMYDPELDAVARDLLAELDWHGLACIEYMRDARTGQYVLTEINPRLWQSLPVAVRAGADFPYGYWLQATGRGDEIVDDYELGVGSHLLHGELAYLVSVLTEASPYVERPSIARTLWDVASSCISDPHFDYAAADDPGPFLAGVRSKFPF
jgi:predicted ATP-grasp superfamily ATP-dependent carboligase